jgi:hypothetical protein
VEGARGEGELRTATYSRLTPPCPYWDRSPERGPEKPAPALAHLFQAGSFDPHFDYIEIPIAAKIGLGSSPVYVLAGPSISFRISDPYDDFEGDASEFLNTVDFGLLGGLGVEFNLGSLQAMADIRYHTGLSVIFDFEEGDDDRNSRNQVISVGMGVALF